MLTYQLDSMDNTEIITNICNKPKSTNKCGYITIHLYTSPA